MGLHVYIRRVDNTPIEWADVTELAENDPELEIKDLVRVDILSGKQLDVKGKFLVLKHADTYLVYANGELSCEEPGEENIRKLEDIACKLNATVIA